MTTAIDPALAGVAEHLPCTHAGSVLPEWIDYNGHLNVAYYVLLMDRATDGFFDLLGLDQDYIRRTKRSTFALDMRIAYRRELMKEAPVRCLSQLHGHDEKRLWVVQYLLHGVEGWIAAVSEWIFLHVDLGARRGVPFAPELKERIAALYERHRMLPRPTALLRPLGFERAAPPG
jgi:acyl-CoA thioester hydrolase